MAQTFARIACDVGGVVTLWDHVISGSASVAFTSEFFAAFVFLLTYSDFVRIWRFSLWAFGHICLCSFVSLLLGCFHQCVCFKQSIKFYKGFLFIWSEWRLTVIAATVRIALVDILDLSEVDIPAGGFLYPAVGWG